MLITAPYIGALRINLSTYEILPFGPGFDYGIGVAVDPHTAVSNDGRYAIVSSKDFNLLKLYDLSTCLGNTPDRISYTLSCQSRDLAAYLRHFLLGQVLTTALGWQ